MTRCFCLIFVLLCNVGYGQQTIKQYLSGTDKDHTVKWDFMVNTGRNSNKWSTIPVPSCWEMQGFGSYNYSEDKINPTETGFYRYTFSVSPQYKGKRVNIVFEASMTDTEVKINGQPAGPIHQGGFYEFRYDITSLLAFNKPNLLEVTVAKKSSNNSVNRAERQSDFWLFGGIFRPVYLEILPPDFIERMAIDARANGDFNVQVFSNATPKQSIEAQVYDLKGVAIEKPFTLKAGDSILTHHFTNIKTWNPEQPNLYKVVVKLKQDGKTIHSLEQRFGFRTVELRSEDGFYVNDKKVIFKGVCRHSEWPETGRTLSRDVHLLDIAAMKGMNMNAVRMSHYPPDKEFLDLCDSLGLFVLDELTGWQKSYDTTIGRKLVKELVVRDVNHPSVVIWDNGNEGGWNRALDGDYALYDPQKRHVIHPWERFDGTNTKHYPDFKYIQKEVASPKEVFFPTEFMHGLFDGGHGAALDDFWNEMLKHPHLGGGFLWSLHDEGVVRADRHDSIDVDGNRAPDGIVGPHREKEGSYYTIKEIWSPVYIDSKPLPANFDGRLKVQNRYIYTNLSQVKFDWKLVNFPSAKSKLTNPIVVQKGIAASPSLAPGQEGIIVIPAAKNSRATALYLFALNTKGDTICTWSWALQKTIAVPLPVTAAVPAVTNTGDAVTVRQDGTTYSFSKETGMLQGVVANGKMIDMSNGPMLAAGQPVLKQLTYNQQGSQLVVEPLYTDDSLRVKWIFEPGKLPRLQYSILPKDTTDFIGITFNYPEEKITGMKWLGRGPYRVWKNRLKGQQFGVWQKPYNNTVTGESWLYPEFKGWHQDVNWVTVQTAQGNITMYTTTPGLYFQMLQPQRPKAAPNNNTTPAFPKGSFGFMHAISPIGTKFQPAAVMGPQSQRNVSAPGLRLDGELYLDIGAG